MARTKQEEKQLNLVLADLFERVVRYRKLTLDRRYGARDRAIWRALVEDAERAFVYAHRALGEFGTNKLAQVKIEFLDSKSVTTAHLVDEDIYEIVKRIYGITVEEREEARRKANDELKRITAITPDIQDEVKDAILLLQRKGVMTEFLKYVNDTTAPLARPANEPRGNPKKGALVKYYMSKGWNHNHAIAKAEEKLAIDPDYFPNAGPELGDLALDNSPEISDFKTEVLDPITQAEGEKKKHRVDELGDEMLEILKGN